MSVTPLFSKRQLVAGPEGPPVLDRMPKKLRVQFIFVLRRLFGLVRDARSPLGHEDRNRMVQKVVTHLCEEHGVLALSDLLPLGWHKEWDKAEEQLYEFLLNSEDPFYTLDVIELSFRCVREGILFNSAGARIRELESTINCRFQEHNVGYRLERDAIIRVSSDFLHAEVVEPALRLLGDKTYAGANEEFRAALEHHRAERHEEALGRCSNALESTLKIICDQRGWRYNEDRATARTLIDLVQREGLLPKILDSQQTALAEFLKQGVPRARNKSSAHGSGGRLRDVEAHLAAFMVHQTAATIVFLHEANEKGRS